MALRPVGRTRRAPGCTVVVLRSPRRKSPVVLGAGSLVLVLVLVLVPVLVPDNMVPGRTVIAGDKYWLVVAAKLDMERLAMLARSTMRSEIWVSLVVVRFRRSGAQNSAVVEGTKLGGVVEGSIVGLGMRRIVGVVGYGYYCG